MKTPNPKALKEAKAYIMPCLRMCMADCSDSTHDCERIEARFDAFVDDTIGIGEFIDEHLREEWVKCLKEYALECEYELDDSFGWVCEPPKPLQDIKKMLAPVKKSPPKHTIKIYGSSDDLVNISGDFNEEFDSYEEDTYLLFSDGTQVKAHYDDEGTWRLTQVEGGTAKWSLIAASETNNDSDAPNYSDIFVLDSDTPLALVKRGHHKLKAPSPQVAQSLGQAKQVIEFLNGRGGFDDWFHEINSDSQNEIVEGIARIIGGKSVEHKSFVLTGTLSITREEAKELIDKAGGHVSSSVTGQTDYLVVGDEPGSKLAKAKEKGVRVLNEKEFLELVE